MDVLFSCPAVEPDLLVHGLGGRLSLEPFKPTPELRKSAVCRRDCWETRETPPRSSSSSCRRKQSTCLQGWRQHSCTSTRRLPAASEDSRAYALRGAFLTAPAACRRAARHGDFAPPQNSGGLHHVLPAVVPGQHSEDPSPRWRGSSSGTCPSLRSDGVSSLSRAAITRKRAQTPVVFYRRK